MKIVDRDRTLLCDVYTSNGRFNTKSLRLLLLPYMVVNQNVHDHAYQMSARLIRNGFIKRVSHGWFEVTEAGKAWCGGANVANPS